MSDEKPNKSLNTVNVGDEQPQMDIKTVRWYVMVLPVCHKGTSDVLAKEKRLREMRGETSFEYLAPTYQEVRVVNGRLIKTDKPLLFNYVFLRASVQTIMEIKKDLPMYNFLPRVREGKKLYYPYLTDEVMQNLQWVAESYKQVLPIYVPKPNQLAKGDKVRILSGRFQGALAEVMVSPGKGDKQVMVRLDEWFCVPLVGVKEGDYEIYELATQSKHSYFKLNDTSLLGKLFEALRQKHASDMLDEKSQQVAQDALARFANMQNVNTDIMRSHLYAILLPAYSLLDMDTEYAKLLDFVSSLAAAIKARQARALLHLTLYACTDSNLWHIKAHEDIKQWQSEEATPKKALKFLIDQLDAFDKAYCHA